MGRANRARVVRGLNLEKRESAWLRFLFRANAFPGQNTEHARLKEVDAVWFGFIKGRIRCGDRGEANDKLGGVGRFSWSVEPKEETFRAAEIILGPVMARSAYEEKKKAEIILGH